MLENNSLDDILGSLKGGEDPQLAEKHKRMRLIAGLGEAFEQAATAGSRARTGQKFDGSFFQGLAGQADQDYQAAISQRQQALKNKILGRKMQIEDEDRTRKLAIEDQANDPTAKAATIKAGLYSKLAPGVDFSGLSSSQLDGLGSAVSAIKSANTEAEKIKAQNELAKAANAAKSAAESKKNQIDRSDKQFDQEKKIRQEYRDNPVVTAAEEGEKGLHQLESNLAQGTKAGDLAAIFNFMKTLDPRSVVREGEQISVQRTDGIFGVMQRYASMFNKEGSLTPDARKELLAAMRAQVDVAKKALPEIQAKYFNPIIAKYGLTTENIYGQSLPKQDKEDEDTNSAFANLQLDASHQGDGGMIGSNSVADINQDRINAFARENGISPSQARMIIERRLQR